MVGHIPLEDGIGVRVPVPQQMSIANIGVEQKVNCFTFVGTRMGVAKSFVFVQQKTDFVTESLFPSLKLDVY